MMWVVVTRVQLASNTGYISSKMVTIHDDAAVISHDDGRGRLWLAAKRSVIKVAKEYRFGRFVGANFAMLEHIIQLRNKKVVALMTERCHDTEGPAVGGSAELPRRRKTSMIDEIDKVIEVDVKTCNSDNPITVKMAASAYDNNVLEIELNRTNMQLLLQPPSAGGGV